MTSREQMIEACQEVYINHWRKDADSPEGACSCGNTLEWGARYSRHVVEAIVDAILPQVTTVEELEALPVATKLIVDRNGAHVSVMTLTFRKIGGRYYAAGHSGTIEWTAETVLEYAAGPLTVVWRPES